MAINLEMIVKFRLVGQYGSQHRTRISVSTEQKSSCDNVVHNTEQGLLSKQNRKALVTMWFITQNKEFCQHRREKLL